MIKITFTDKTARHSHPIVATASNVGDAVSRVIDILNDEGRSVVKGLSKKEKDMYPQAYINEARTMDEFIYMMNVINKQLTHFYEINLVNGSRKYFIVEIEGAILEDYLKNK